MIMNEIKLIALLGALGLASANAVEPVDVSKLPPASTQANVTFATDIKPLFDKACVKCHSGEKPKGKLRLDSLDNVLKGGTDGKVVRPGASEKSRIVLSVAHLGEEDDWMPPLHNKAKIPPLTKDQIGLIRAWIDQGAK